MKQEITHEHSFQEHLFVIFTSGKAKLYLCQFSLNIGKKKNLKSPCGGAKKANLKYNDFLFFLFVDNCFKR